MVKVTGQHHYTYVPLETAIASLYTSINLWISIVVVGTNLISTLYCSIMMCNVCNILHIALNGNIPQYSAHAILLKHENVCHTDIVGPNITKCR